MQVENVEELLQFKIGGLVVDNSVMQIELQKAQLRIRELEEQNKAQQEQKKPHLKTVSGGKKD